MEPCISTDKDKLNTSLIHDFISQSYRGTNRTREQTEGCIEHSMNFGLYLNGRQAGYARVVSDFTIIAHLMDVFIVEKERSKGYATILMSHILNHQELKQVRSWKLWTDDARELYRKFGFFNVSDHMMELDRQ